MKSLMEMADDKPALPEKAKRIIERRTGYPKGLLEKTEEKVEEFSPRIH